MKTTRYVVNKNGTGEADDALALQGVDTFDGERVLAIEINDRRRCGFEKQGAGGRLLLPIVKIDELIRVLLSIRSELGLDDAGRGRKATGDDQHAIVDLATKIRNGDVHIRSVMEQRIPQGKFATIFLAQRGEQQVVANIMLPLNQQKQGVVDEAFAELAPEAKVEFDGA